MNKKDVSINDINYYFQFDFDSSAGCYCVTRSNYNKEILEIPSTINGYKVVEIFLDAFRDNTSIKSLILSEGLLKINFLAFRNCYSLKSIYIPSTVICIEDGAFCDAQDLEEIKVSEDNSCYDSRGNCNAIISTRFNFLICGSNINIKNSDYKFIVPPNIYRISEYAFSGRRFLKTIEFPDSLVIIDNCAFRKCISLKSIYIPLNVNEIGEYVFNYTNSLESIVVDENNETYDSRNNCNAIIETSKNSLKYGCYKTIIPESVERIDKNAFRGCTLLESITIPEGVDHIGDSAFEDCENLKSITLPKSLHYIGDYAFKGCKKLESIKIPSSCKHIANNAFENTTNLISIEVVKRRFFY